MKHEGRDRQHHPKVDEEGQSCRPGAEFGEQPREQRAERRATRIGDRDREGGLAAVAGRFELLEGGGARSRHHARRDALESAGDEKGEKTFSARENRRRRAPRR